MSEFISKLLGNKLVVWIVAALIVFGLLKMTGLTFHFEVGEAGIGAGIDSSR